MIKFVECLPIAVAFSLVAISAGAEEMDVYLPDGKVAVLNSDGTWKPSSNQWAQLADGGRIELGNDGRWKRIPSQRSSFNAPILPRAFMTDREKSYYDQRELEKRQRAQDAKYRPFVAEMQQSIKRHWNPPKSTRNYRCVVDFSVDAKGEVGEVTVAASSGDQAVDKASVDAVQSAAPFLPLPPDVQTPFGVQFSFEYSSFTDERNIRAF